MRKLVVLALASITANSALAGPAALGAPMGAAMGVAMGEVVGGVLGSLLGTAMPVAGGGLFLIAAVSLAAGIGIIRHKQNRHRKEPLQ